MNAVYTAKSAILCLFVCWGLGCLGCESDDSREDVAYEAVFPPMSATISPPEPEPPVTPEECVADITDLSMEEIRAVVEENELPVVLMVSSNGCGYCSQYMKDFKRVCVGYYGTAQFVHVNSTEVYEREGELLPYYQGHAPTTHFYYDGEEFRKISGKLEKEELIEAMGEFLLAVYWYNIDFPRKTE